MTLREWNRNKVNGQLELNLEPVTIIEKAPIEVIIDSQKVENTTSDPWIEEENTSISPTLEEVDKMTLRELRKLCKPLGIIQKVNGKDIPKAYLRERIKQELVGSKKPRKGRDYQEELKSLPY